MSNVQDFLRYRAEARAIYPDLKQWALVVQDGTEPEWRHFNSAGIPQYNIPMGYDMNANQVQDLVGYHEPGHEYEEFLRRKDPTMAHRQKFMTFIGHPISWEAQKKFADAQSTPNGQHDADPGEWWADAFANAVAGKVVVDKDRTADAIKMRSFFLSLSGGTMFSTLTSQVTLSPNKWPRLNKPRYVVLHTTEGGGPGSLGWMCNPLSQVAAHYIVMEDGQLVGMVDERDAAWHAGIVVKPRTSMYIGINPNLESIGIEMAGYHDVPITYWQIAKTAALIKDIRSRYGPLPVVPHSDLDTVNRFDPGVDNLNRVMAVVDGDDMAYADIAENVKDEIRHMLLNQEGYDLVENAILHKYAIHLQAYLDQKFAESEKRVIDAIVLRITNG